MSARAAARLASLGFNQLYRYQAGKADWLAAGLAREGRDTGTPRTADVADRDVATCQLDEDATALLTRLRERNSEIAVVIDDQRVVLGLVQAEDLKANAVIEQIMEPAPLTIRPHLAVEQTREQLANQARRALVTTSNGVLIGLFRC